MGVLIGSIEFDGPFGNSDQLREEPGLFAIFCQVNGELELLDLDEIQSVRDCMEVDEFTNNLRFWQENCSGPLMAAVHYTPGLSPGQRQSIKTELLSQL